MNLSFSSANALFNTQDYAGALCMYQALAQTTPALRAQALQNSRLCWKALYQHSPAAARKRAIIVTCLTGQNIISDPVLCFLETLRDVADLVIVELNGQTAQEHQWRKELGGLADMVFATHTAHPFVAYEHGINYLKHNELTDLYDEIVLCTDQLNEPLPGFPGLFYEMERQPSDAWSIPQTPPCQEQRLNSNFIVLHSTALHHPVMNHWLDAVRQDAQTQENAPDLTAQHEMTLTQLLEENGLQLAWCDAAQALGARSNAEDVNNKKGQKANTQAARRLRAGSGMTKQPSFSIILPTYNRAHCLHQAIDSVLAQKYDHYELIVVDDGSTDSTERLVHDRYTEHIEQGRLVYLKKLTREGVCRARNTALQRVRHEWVAYMDSDNMLRPHFLAMFARQIRRHPELNTHYCNFRTHSGKIIGAPFDYSQLRKQNFIDLAACRS